MMDLDWTSHPEYCSSYHPQGEQIDKPVSLDKMVEMATKLAGKFPFVRIDFYEDDEKPVFGEMTFTPGFSSLSNVFLNENRKRIENMTKEKSKSLNDYKFYCVNGEPLYVIVYTDRVANSHDMKRTIYDMDWQLHQEYLGRLAVPGPDIERPKSFDLMKEMAAKLSSPFPFVRIDFYEINDKPVFGEMTFTPGMQETSTEFADRLGERLVL